MSKKRKKHPSKFYRWSNDPASLDEPPAAPQPDNVRGKKKRRRITDGLIALSSAVVLSVYSIGYLHTHYGVGQAGGLEVAQPSSSASAPPRATASAITPVQPQGPTDAATATSYRDGTYVGLGSSRHGDIEATVVVQAGKIQSASVSACMTRYSCAYMNPLVREVLDTQDAPVDHVSGATDSSRAYTEAIQIALAEAL